MCGFVNDALHPGSIAGISILSLSPFRTKVVIVEDHRMVAQSLAVILEREFEILAIAESCAQALEAVHRRNPELVLIDINLGRENGFDLITPVRQLTPSCKFIMLTGFNLPGFHTRARELGANGFVSKTNAFACLIEAVTTVSRGGTWYCDPQDGIQTERHSVDGPVHLTRRQLDVLGRLEAGLTYQQIGRDLGLSENTVDVYLRRIRQILGARNGIELIRIARKRGLFPRERVRLAVPRGVV